LGRFVLGRFVGAPKFYHQSNCFTHPQIFPENIAAFSGRNITGIFVQNMEFWSIAFLAWLS
jgi:hypothetical protein